MAWTNICTEKNSNYCTEKMANNHLTEKKWYGRKLLRQNDKDENCIDLYENSTSENG